MHRLERLFILLGLVIVGLQYAVEGPVLGAAKGVAILPLVLNAWRATQASEPSSGARAIFLGAVASLIGDVAIEFSFVAGLFSFLVAHLCYLASMGKPRGLPTGNFLALLPACAWLATVTYLIGPQVGAEMQLPVLIYISVIMVLLCRATLQATTPDASASSKVLAVGIWLFALSDSLIAISRWFQPVPLRGVWVMTFYYAGQLLIVRSAGSASRSAFPHEQSPG